MFDLSKNTAAKSMLSSKKNQFLKSATLPIIPVLLISVSLLTACGGSSKPGSSQTNLNTPFQITSIASQTAQEGIPYSYDVNTTGTNSGDILTYSLISPPTGMSINSDTGIIVWTPSSNQVGTKNVSVLVTDNGSPKLSISQDFSITVKPVSNTVSKTSTIRVNAGGSDHIDNNGQLWTADYGYNTGGASQRNNTIDGTGDDVLYQTERWHSTWNDTSTPELEYQFNVPNGNYAVKLHFAEITTYVNRIFDIEIEGQLSIDNLNIVDEAGRNNVLVKNIATTVNDGVLNIRFPRDTQSPKISAIEILPSNSQTNASTTDISPVSIEVPESQQMSGTLSIISQPSNGTARINGNNITYNPNTGFGGDDTVIYMLVEADGSITISTITVNVDPVSVIAETNPVITANPDSSSTSTDTPINIPVLVNDSGINDTAILKINANPGNGKVKVLANNTITYTPDPSYSGTDNFSYRVTIDGIMAVATVSVDVQGSQDKTIALSWNPSVDDNNIGYRVYFGTNSTNVNTLAADLSSSTGLDVNAPSVQLSAQRDLQLQTGDKVCFRISAYLSSEESALSSPICGIL